MMPSLNVCTVRVFLTRIGTLVSVVQHLEVGDTSRRDRSHGVGVWVPCCGGQWVDPMPPSGHAGPAALQLTVMTNVWTAVGTLATHSERTIRWTLSSLVTWWVHMITTPNHCAHRRPSRFDVAGHPPSHTPAHFMTLECCDDELLRTLYSPVLEMSELRRFEHQLLV